MNPSANRADLPKLRLLLRQMPNNEGSLDMTSIEISRFQRALEAKQREFAEQVGLHIAKLAISDSEHDPIDQVQSMHRREEAVTMIAGYTTALADVEASLRAISEGTYGECVDCGEPIGLKRLEAIPWAPRCVRCEQRIEAGEAKDQAA
jgi:DnaK suppressor protein